ncbi:MAG TPA: sigma-54 dependent transcriptional regulator, partial [Candidatus Sulfomarinibacteraceae bacterium]|nr:sigma-54 dependent transcriptional regulator [Candidatus Sulfomarinibacteraceae bacterium]
ACYHVAMEGRVLIIDDDAGVRKVLDRILSGAGYQVEQATDAFQALDLLDALQPDAALLDIKMPGMDGFGLLENLAQRGLDIPVVILTGHGDQFTASDCLDAGAAAYLTKPPDRADLLLAVRGAVAQGRVSRELAPAEEPPPLLGDSAAIARLREEIARVAPSHATVLILGESGTGKELVARRLHHLSGRARRPFVRVNCAAIPEELIESELFGHEKGSFTGAHRRQVGKFVQADQGTIFLDEVADMSLKTQAKVLRVLQDGEVEPVGAERPFSVSVRVIAATNRDLTAAVADGAFREDLYYRLAVVLLRTPPLREHPGDIPLLVEHLTERFCAEYNRRPKSWSGAALDQLARHPWPGNVRELKNVVERAVIMELEDTIDHVELFAGAAGGDELERLLAEPTLADFQRASEIAYLLHHLERNGWNVAATARAIGTPRSNLYKKMQAYDISREDG